MWPSPLPLEVSACSAFLPDVGCDWLAHVALPVGGRRWDCVFGADAQWRTRYRRCSAAYQRIAWSATHRQRSLPAVADRNHICSPFCLTTCCSLPPLISRSTPSRCRRISVIASGSGRADPVRHHAACLAGHNGCFRCCLTLRARFPWVGPRPQPGWQRSLAVLRLFTVPAACLFQAQCTVLGVLQPAVPVEAASVRGIARGRDGHCHHAGGGRCAATAGAGRAVTCGAGVSAGAGAIPDALPHRLRAL